jgi:phage baseplate assembly protein W
VKDIRVVIPNAYNYAITTSTDIPLSTEGIDSLVQIIVKAMKTTPGRDLLSPDYGMGLKYLLPPAASSIEEEKTKSQVGKGLLKIDEDIKKNQTDSSLTPDQKLQTLDLLDVTFDQTQGLWDITVQVTSVSGTTVNVGVSF